MFSNWKPRARPVAFSLALVAVALAAWWPVLQNDFVNYDDPVYVTENPHVQGGLTWAEAAWAFRTGHGANWHPLTWLSHLLDCRLWGLRPWGHHLTSLLFHAANTLLLFLLLNRMTGSHWRSALVAALFAWHPLHVESVAWVAERKDVLSTFFGLLAIWAYARWVEKSKVRGGAATQPATLDTQHASRFTFHVSAYYLLSLLCFALSLISKPMLVTLPFLLLLLDYWPLKRIRNAECGKQNAGGSARPAAFNIQHASFIILEKLPFLALSAASCAVTLLVQQRGGALITVEELRWGERLSNAALAYAGYLARMLWPVRLAVFYPYHPPSSFWPFLFACVLLVAITAAAVLWRRKRPYVFVGWFWFLGSLVPVIGLVQVGAQAMADRYTYLPLLGLFIALAWLLPDLLGRWRLGTLALAAAGTAAVLLCLPLTRNQIAQWRNSETLFRHALSVTTGNYVAHANLAQALVKRGAFQEAEAEFSASLKMQPGHYTVMYALASLVRTNQNPQAALELFRQALALRPNDATAHYNQAIVLAELHQPAEAIEQYRQALRLDPNLPQAHNNLAALLLLQGKAEEALAHALTASRLDPASPQARLNAGDALFVQEKFAEAAAQYRAALKLNPSLAKAHLNLAKALVNQDQLQAAAEPLATAARLGPNNPEPYQVLAKIHVAQKRGAEALQDYGVALRLDPGWVEGMNDLAWLRATHPDPKLRDGAQAVELASRASALSGGTNATVQQTLAAAYAEAGMFRQAVEAQQWACFLSINARGVADGRARQRLELYQAEKPYHEP